MIEIALCLAIIGFALVAIIGILPAGMQVQKDNREDTIVPRLLAAGADLQRVHFWDEALLGPPVFPEACRELQQVL